jgi:hypothetical protein
MSKGLGKMQRYILALVEAQEAAHEKAANDDPEGDKLADWPRFWITWPEIRNRAYEDFRPSDWNQWRAIERSAKRALLTLWRQKKVGRIHDDRWRCYFYMTAATYDENFTPERPKRLLAKALERTLAKLKQTDTA